MPKTKTTWRMDRGFNDGIFVFGPEDIVGLAAADCVMTRAAAGDYNLSVGATKTVTFSLWLGKLLQRLGFTADHFEQFGGTGIFNPEKAGVYGTDYTGNPETARTAAIPKGIKIKGFKVSWDPGNVADLSAHTCRLDKIVYANGIANAVTNPLASGANGLVVTKSATPRVVQVDLAAGEQIYRVTDLSALRFEIGAQTPGGGQYKLQAIEVLVDFNYN